jgi:predicted nucleic acid-binding protein
MKSPHFLDTNVLLYSISRDPTAAVKRERAIALLEQDNGALSLQARQEFYVHATRSSRPDRLPHAIAAGLIATWTCFRVRAITVDILHGALEIRAAHGFSWRDSAIIAAARALGCRKLYTEDLGHGREVEGVLILNPFR